MTVKDLAEVIVAVFGLAVLAASAVAVVLVVCAIRALPLALGVWVLWRVFGCP